MFLKIKCFIIPFFLLLFFSSCNDEVETDNQNKDLNFVTISEAKELVSEVLGVNSQRSASQGKKSSISSKRVKNIKPFVDEQNEVVFHIANYEGGGFVILSADKRAMPILAYSENGEFAFDENQLPDGLKDWITYSKSYISGIRKTNRKQTEGEAKMWSVKFLTKAVAALDGQPMPIDDDPDDPINPSCQDIYTTVGPLLQTKWGQGCGYNNLLGYCSDVTYCNRMPTGCVATAMAQVMRYHRYPATYNWSIMPNSMTPDTYEFGNTEVARLMSDIGVKVGMGYGCDGSKANTKAEVASSFVNDFGYSSARYEEYNAYSRISVLIELDNRRPVIFRGADNSGNGHAWVCDGYSRAIYCEPAVSTLHLHMNWGWNGKYDTYYAYNNFNPDGNSFNYECGVVINIKP